MVVAAVAPIDNYLDLEFYSLLMLELTLLVKTYIQGKIKLYLFVLEETDRF